MNQFIFDFIKKGTAEFDTSGKKYKLCRGKIQDSDALFEIQEKLPLEIYIPSSLKELTSAAENNELYIIKQGEIFAAYMILLMNGNKSYYAEFTDEKNFAVIDSVYVERSFRGIHLQMLLLNLAEELTQINKISSLAATVSEQNQHSLSNFINSGYIIVKNVNYNLSGELKPRLLVMKKLNHSDALVL